MCSSDLSIYDIYQYEKYPHQRTHAPLLWIGFTASFNIKSNGGGSTTKTTKSAPSSGGGSYTRPSSTTTPSINRSNPRPTPKPKAKPQVKPKPTPSSGGPR